MGKVVISLVSEQRMQNIIPVFQAGMDIEKMWLVRSTEADTQESRFSKALQNTVECLQTTIPVKLADPSIGAYGIAETQQLIADLIREESPDRAIVNFTGGTKCMSIGAYLAAQDARVPALYVDTANEKLIWFDQDGQVRQDEFDLARRLTVDIYLRANGQ